MSKRIKQLLLFDGIFKYIGNHKQAFGVFVNNYCKPRSISWFELHLPLISSCFENVFEIDRDPLLGAFTYVNVYSGVYMFLPSAPRYLFS